MESQKALRNLLMNTVIVSIVISSIYFTNKIRPGFMHELFSLNFEGLTTFFVILIIHSVIALFILYKIFKNRKSKLADSKLLSFKDVNREQKRVKTGAFYPKPGKFMAAKSGYYQDKSSLVISRNLKLRTKKSHEHVLVIGPTGSGKSAHLIKPILFNLDNASVVITDPKGELCRDSRKSLERKGYRVIHLNFNNSNQSARYNILATANNHDDVRKIREAILEGEGNDEWGKLSATLLDAFLFHEFECGEKNISNVVRTMSQVEIKEMDDFFYESNSKAANMSYAQFKKTASGDGYVSSVYATIQSKMKVFEYDSVENIGSSNDFIPGDLRLNKIALFISYPEDEAKIYSPYLAAFFYQLFNKIKTHESVDESNKNANGLPVHFLLDEAANIGKIPELDVLLATVRSKKMSILMGIQSFDQLKKVYDKASNIIVENCKTKIILGGTTGETARFFSELVGEETHESISISSGQKKDLSSSVSESKKYILSQDQIRRLKTYELVVVCDNLKPIKDDKVFYWFSQELSFWIYKNGIFNEELNTKIASIVEKFLKEKKKNKRAAASIKTKPISPTKQETNTNSTEEERRKELERKLEEFNRKF